MLSHYLPNFDKEKSKLYTPIGIKNLFQRAIEIKNGDIDAVFKDKHRNKNLIELYHASFLALAIKKWLGKEYSIYPSDAPDTYFVDIKTSEAFPVEIMELFFYSNNFDGDYKQLASYVLKTKGCIKILGCHLLIVSRLNTDFNLSKLQTEIAKYSWNFERIWFCVYSECLQQWTIYEIIPVSSFDKLNCISFDLNKDRALYY